jgi:hypothetical protein
MTSSKKRKAIALAARIYRSPPPPPPPPPPPTSASTQTVTCPQEPPASSEIQTVTTPQPPASSETQTITPTPPVSTLTVTIPTQHQVQFHHNHHNTTTAPPLTPPRYEADKENSELYQAQESIKELQETVARQAQELRVKAKRVNDLTGLTKKRPCRFVSIFVFLLVYVCFLSFIFISFVRKSDN